MSYEDLEEARAKRAAKEEAAASTRERGRKLKGCALGTHTVSSMGKDKATQAGDGGMPTQASTIPWRAPVARMYQMCILA
jgi:hypothetical protein